VSPCALKLSLTSEEKDLFAKKLGVEADKVEEYLKGLVGVRVFVHYVDKRPEYRGVRVHREFSEMSMFSATCTLRGLLKLLRDKSVVRIEKVPRVKLL
jgi:hypothetical protein